MSLIMARFSARVVRSAWVTCRSWLLATMQAYGARESRTAAVSGSSAAFMPTRRVKPKATSCALRRVTAPSAIAEKYAVSPGLAPGQPPSMKFTPSSSSKPVMASLSVTERFSPSCCDPSRRVVSNTWNSAGFARSWENMAILRDLVWCPGMKKPPVPGTGGQRAEADFSALGNNHRQRRHGDSVT